MDDKQQESLACLEKLDRNSPDLWPEQVPGISEYAKTFHAVDQTGVTDKGKVPTKFKTDLDADDIRLVNELGQLSADQLMEHIKNIQNTAYQLGSEEAKQLSRGKLLKVLEQPEKKW